MQPIRIDYASRTGGIKPLHGLNNGPVCYGSKVNVSNYYAEAGVPWVRIHDPNWPYPQEVDIHMVFPDFEGGDPENPDDYDFDRTDTYIRSILDTGAKIVYRLGESIEHENPRFCLVPSDSAKWAAVCRGIVRHYNHGWANGFHYGITHWEVWNEAEWQQMWPGTPQQFYELYRDTALTLKQLDPELKVGGFACGSGVFTPFTEGFLAYCREHKLPLDFLSWHGYRGHPAQLVSMALRVRSMLDDYGFPEAESHFNEWNYMNFAPGKNWKDMWSDPYIKRDMFERGKGAEGASFSAAVMIALQDAYVDVANYYDGQPSSIFCGLFDYYGVPQKTFHAFKAIGDLYRLGNRVQTDWEHGRDNLYACAAISGNGQSAMALLVNFGTEAREAELLPEGLPTPGGWVAEISALDQERQMGLVATRPVDGVLAIRLPAYSIAQVRFQRAFAPSNS